MEKGDILIIYRENCTRQREGTIVRKQIQQNGKNNVTQIRKILEI